MNWEFISEANAHLTETELRYYGDIFLYCCDNTDPDNVPVVKAAELFRSANLPRDITIKILDICVGSKVNNHMGRKQFYAALKLVAAHQAGLDIHRDMTINSLEMATPLPRFSWPTSGDEDTSERRSKDCMVSNAKTLAQSVGLTGSHLPESTTESESDAESPRETGGSTDSPTPTNSVTQERIIDGLMVGDTILDSASGSWQGLLVSEEQRQLLGTEEESSERHSSDEADGDGDASSFPPEEVWIISEEQRDYYAAQFSRLQPNPEGLLAGSVARTFFEKSRLPVAELRRIWQLADVTRDGALSLQEFYVAMHLVVLRRNHVPLPDSLPPSLAFTLTVPPPPLPALASVVAAEVSPPQPPPPPPPTPPTQTNTQISQSQSQSQTQGSPDSRTTGTTLISNTAVNTREKNKEWTKFVDSPTGSAGALASPGPKPKFIVNFDLQKAAVERDPKILHPVPLRLTPEAAILASTANGNNSTAGLVDEDVLLSAVNLGQRSLNKKSLNSNDDGLAVTPKKEPPPPPPPRPYRTHTRSSSLDLNKLGAPPSVPPRISPGVSSPRKLVGQKSECDDQRITTENPSFVADFSHFSPKSEDVANLETAPANQSQQFAGVCGAFHIYRKPSPKPGEGEEEGKDDTDDSKSLTLEELREKNSELRLVCEELTRELAGALQERINLRAKLLLIT
ncbi:ralBP1-associated Eps domain-containing protein 1 isoform X2 [Microplitis demolitor]|uniref:ralBP1-associated Eps domain-containing protein 1 isoform X2 n=1 Tax=Microplitis demolitor TaxID=69319 RepID=UPI0004CD039D|nr:ralBP1-associated Eps domain-containing protein 1 isoform X2 [Microplitis demolitor]